MDSTLTKLIKEDSLLPDHIKCFGEIPKPSECKIVLLTGVTGNLGPYLLKCLLERPHLKIYCLVRKTSLHLAQNILDSLEIPIEVHARVQVIPGDLSVEKFGLDLQQYKGLCSEVDAVIHSAVKSSHLEMYVKQVGKPNDLRSVNVLGTLKIMEFATTGKVKRIFYASSILACNRFSETENLMSEELVDDDNYGDGIGMGYAASKFVGDKLMSQAIRRGIPCFVCRYSLIVGESQSGYLDTKNNHYLYLMISFIESGMQTIYPSSSSLIPVDISAKISINLFFNDNVPSGIFNLMNPHSIKIKTFFNDILRQFGIEPLKTVEFPKYTKSLIDQGKNSTLYPFRMLYFQEDTLEILTHFNVVTKLLTTIEGGKILHGVSDKLHKWVPEINDLIDTPHNLLTKMLKVARERGMF